MMITRQLQVALSLCGLLAIGRLHAQDGELDPSFGSGGIVLSDLGFDYQFAHGSAVQEDGKVLITGGTSGEPAGAKAIILRYEANGELDTSFNGVGYVLWDTLGAGTQARAIGIQDDGRIVTVGSLLTNGTGNYFAAWRYNTNGAPDTSFGGDGMVFFHVGRSARGMALQSDGKLLMTGWTDIDTAFLTVRLNLDGSLDTSFNHVGWVTTPLPSAVDKAHCIAVDGNGKIVVAGEAQENDFSDVAIVRYYSDGTLDSAFGGGDGMVITSVNSGEHARAYSVGIRSDGRIVAMGGSPGSVISYFIALCYDQEGTLDTQFGMDGIAAYSPTGTIYDAAFAGILQPDDKVLICGNGMNTDVDFAVMRLDAGGDVDNTFGANGVVTTDLGAFSDIARAIALYPDGRIVMCGGGGVFNLVRYITDLDLGLVDRAQAGYDALVFPNPIQPGSVLKYELDSSGSISLRIVAADGSLARSLISDEERGAGSHAEHLDLNGLRPGHYSLLMTIGAQTVEVKVIKAVPY